MSTEQLSEIRNYLLSRNLPLDILAEVQDHFVSQITELQRTEHLGFAEALEKTKNSWKPALNFPNYKIQYDLNDTTFFLRKIREEESKIITKQNAVIASFGLVALIFGAYAFSEDGFLYWFIALFGLSFIIPCIYYLKNLKNFKLAKENKAFKLSIHQDASRLTLIIVGSFMPVLFNIEKLSAKTYQALHVQPDEWFHYSQPLLFAFIFWLNAYCFFSQRRYLASIERAKSVLKYL